MISATAPTPSSKRALLAIALAGVGCSNTVKAPPTAEDYEVMDWLSGKEREDAESFQHFDSISASLASATAVQLYEGLPHYLWEDALYESELESKPNVQLDGESFYTAPVPLANIDIKVLQELVSRKESFVPLRGWKTCGGFHADWRLDWAGEDGGGRAHLCFGCGEMIATSGGKRVYCDIWDEELFADAFNKHTVNRPLEQSIAK